MKGEAVLEETTYNLTSILSKINVNNILWAAFVTAAGCVIVKYIMKVVSRLILKAPVDKTLKSISISVIKFVLYFLLATVVADMLGLPPASLVTVLGTLGLAFSLAMQDSLSNIAGGILILYTAPFKPGDYIESGGINGTVEKIGLIHTSLTTIDNKKIYVPNATLSKEKIINFSSETHRQLEIIFPIGYGADIKMAKSIIENVVENCRYVEKEKDVFIRVWNLGESSVDIIARCWTKREDLIEARCLLMEEVKYALDAKNISIPYNQLDVHIQNGDI